MKMVCSLKGKGVMFKELQSGLYLVLTSKERSLWNSVRSGWVLKRCNR